MPTCLPHLLSLITTPQTWSGIWLLRKTERGTTNVVAARTAIISKNRVSLAPLSSALGGRHLVGHSKGCLDCLMVIEARVAICLIVLGQHLFSQTHGAADHLSDVTLARHLHVDASKHRSTPLVDGHDLAALGKDVSKHARLELVALSNRSIAMDAIALPGNGDSTVLDSLDVAREHGLGFARPVARDEHKPALFFGGVQDLDQFFELVVLH
mmetsp:Transcript_39415/g.70494  ORF Transcript_39415/g.70494 Transcript_39415/m.70494 type:complete len:212 (+) Transcript_39415:56-691(+)